MFFAWPPTLAAQAYFYVTLTLTCSGCESPQASGSQTPAWGSGRCLGASSGCWLPSACLVPGRGPAQRDLDPGPWQDLAVLWFCPFCSCVRFNPCYPG